MPSLATVRQEGWRPGRLGQYIGSSRSLRQVDGSFDGGEWSSVFEHIPVAPAGRQGGPLAQLERIGTIVVEGTSDPAGVERLQEVLVARGCRRSLKQLHVHFSARYAISRKLPTLLALDRLVTKCCRPDAPLTLTTASHWTFDLSIFCHPDFPTRPSPPLKTMMQQLAQQATSVEYIFTQDGLTDSHSDPSPAAIDIASTLSFDKADEVVVENAPGLHPPADTPSPHPVVIAHLQRFPKASVLSVRNRLGGAAGRLLADKMPKQLGRVCIERVSGAEEKVGVLTALGREREVGTVQMGEVDVNQLAEAAEGLPTIKTLRLDQRLDLTLPNDVEDASSFVRAGLSSVITHIRGLQCVDLYIDKTTAEQRAFIEASFPDGTNIEGFSVTRIFYAATYLRITAARNA